MNKDQHQQQEEIGRALESEFYEIQDSSFSQGKRISLRQSYQQSENRVLESEEEVSSVEEQIQINQKPLTQQNQSDHSTSKFLHTCSTDVLESRRVNWEDETLREIQQRRESEEGGSVSSDSKKQSLKEEDNQLRNLELEDYQFQQKCSSPWAVNEQDFSSIHIQESTNKKKTSIPSNTNRNRKKKKSKQLQRNAKDKTNKDKSQLIVRLKYGQNRVYSVGMKDLNKKWFEMLNSIHKGK